MSAPRHNADPVRRVDDAIDPNAPNHAPHGERHMPLRSPTAGTNWSETMRRGRPTKGKGVPGQRRG